jgi:hypothetical protein
MFVILEKWNGIDTENIINVFYGDDIAYVNAWMYEYIQMHIKSLEMCPVQQGLKEVSYNMLPNYSINCTSKKVNKGYIYNSSETSSKTVMTLKVLEFDGNTVELPNFQQENMLLQGLNEEMNSRVMKQLDRDSLYQVICKIHQYLMVKKQWSTLEYTHLVSEAIQNFKKELYSNIVKKLARYGNRSCSLSAKKKYD